jgi:hypothetical protein
MASDQENIAPVQIELDRAFQMHKVAVMKYQIDYAVDARTAEGMWLFDMQNKVARADARKHTAPPAKRKAPSQEEKPVADDGQQAKTAAPAKKSKKSARLAGKKAAAAAPETAPTEPVEIQLQEDRIPVLAAPSQQQMVTPPPAAVVIKAEKRSSTTVSKPAIDVCIREIFSSTMGADVAGQQAWLQYLINEKITTVAGVASSLSAIKGMDKEDKEEQLAQVFGRPTSCDDRRRFDTAVQGGYSGCMKPRHMLLHQAQSHHRCCITCGIAGQHLLTSCIGGCRCSACG